MEFKMKDTPKRRRYQKDTAPADDIITLIHLVRQNPTLYNYKLQPNQRRRSDVLNGWAAIAEKIGNKYTVEECRRKWKNLRDTYHQYRLRKQKSFGLSKWRYAKELDFLSNIYQPKLKSHRRQHYESSMHATNDDDNDDNVTNGIHDHHSGISLGNDDAEAFILTTYEESVNDPVQTDHISQMELAADDVDVEDVEDVEEIVKHEDDQLEEDDVASVADASAEYEEVCLYEEAGNGPSVDCEILGSNGTHSTANDSKTFQFIDANEFCIEPIITHTQLPSGSNLIGNSKIKTLTKLTTVATTCASVISSATTTLPSISNNGHLTKISSPPILQLQHNQHQPQQQQQQQQISHHQQNQQQQQHQQQLSPIICTQTREELDLFFDFLKKKMQRFPKEELTEIQVEFLNCVLKREAESARKLIATTSLQ